ncbi:partner and localizer of BRCA2 [Acanthochromis polyacanthus]|uniref:partner and localizer of BRCA2 n=1 Tax=Acanthochromis polyacanthus TaxID=80966 RepID=UPI00223461A9|nr:partner and localizer of BRCA2 [Acanthochromis polyacanthus]
MDTKVGDLLQCDDQLRTTLHCDDKEKLRRKLAQLQREYLKTAQRLQRAERLDAVRKHVRSRITQQNQQDQKDPQVSSHPRLSPTALILNSGNATDTGRPQSQGHTEDSDNPRRSQVIRFLLPSDAACPETPDSCHDALRGHRPSPALRLRSRRSRLRWEKRSAEAGRSTDDSEKHKEQSEGTESAGTAEEVEKIKSQQTNVANESEELFSSTESESPSRHLTQWNTHGCTEAGDMEGMEIQGCEEPRQKETELKTEGIQELRSSDLLLTCCNPASTTEQSGQDGTENGGRKERVEDGEHIREQGKKRLCEENSNKDIEQNATENADSENKHNSSVEVKEEKNGITGDGKGGSLLDSCTLVEGLLFPVEYYVRTTRRMSLSQSQPDMQAVIVSQLNMGRKRRSQGRGTGLNRNTHTAEHSDQHVQTDCSSVTTASVDPLKPSHVQVSSVSAVHSQSSSKILDHINPDACFSSTVTTARPARGRRRKRGRGRGRPQTPRSAVGLNTCQLSCVQTSGHPQPTSTPVSSSESLHGADGPKPCLTAETVSVSDESQPVSIHSTSSQSCPAVNEAPSCCAPEHLKKNYPIFLKNTVKTDTAPQITRDTSRWPCVLLPSSPPAAQTSLFPLPSLSAATLVNSLMKMDMPQDFHLPDDRFASFKLHKLRQVAMESGVEHLSPSSYNTQNSDRRSDPRCSSSDPVTLLPLPLSLTPKITTAPRMTEELQAAAPPVHLSISSIEHKVKDKLINQSVSVEQSDRDITETHVKQLTENLHYETHCSPTETASMCADDCVDKREGNETEAPNSCSQSILSVSSTHRSIKYPDCADGLIGKESDNVTESSGSIQQPASEKQIKYSGVDQPLEELTSGNPQAENRAVTEALTFASPLQEAPEEPPDSSTAMRTCSDTKDAQDSPVKHLKVKSPAEHSKEPSEPGVNLSANKLIGNKTPYVMHHSVHSQLLLTSPPASAPDPFTTPRLPSSTLTSSPTLPSVGLTPHPVPLTSSPSAPSLTLPPPHSPSTQALSPPALSPCPSISSLPPSQPEPASCATPSSLQLLESCGQAGLTTEEKAEERMTRCTLTLKAAAGGTLVDACCLPGSSGRLSVAAAGKWAVCLWSQTSASDWSLVHTWTFNEPVISVFAVPDAARLICVTLGQLEIREVRMLSCSSLTQTLFCEGVVQAAVGVSKSRVVTSSHSATGSTLQVFTLSDSSSSPSSLPLASPGVCVGALAPVDGVSDSLIGTDEGGHLFVWNLKTGQLLCRIPLGDSLSHTACLRGYSYCGVLFVLLQHHFLSSLEEEKKEVKMRDGVLWDKEMKTALFSLVAINPLSGKSILATQLYPPEAWSGRLCEADVSRSGVVGLSQNGCVCVWELGGRWGSQMLSGPESEGWQLARWGGGDLLVTGHHNGDVTLHCCSTSHTHLCLENRF